MTRWEVLTAPLFLAAACAPKSWAPCVVGTTSPCGCIDGQTGTQVCESWGCLRSLFVCCVDSGCGHTRCGSPGGESGRNHPWNRQLGRGLESGRNRGIHLKRGRFLDPFRNVTTDDLGNFEFDQVPSGTYKGFAAKAQQMSAGSGWGTPTGARNGLVFEPIPRSNRRLPLERRNDPETGPRFSSS